MIQSKNIVLIVSIALVSFDALAQGVNLNWAKSFGGEFDDKSSFVSVDSKGNVISTGTFQGSIDLDPGTDTLRHNSKGQEDVFIQKLDPEGNLIWAKSIGGNAIDVATSIGVDANGNIYVCGYFSDTVDFDPGLGTFELSAPEFDDCFFLKLDENGNFVWAKSTNGGYSRAFAISIDNDENVFATGPFEKTVDFDPGPSEAPLSANGAQDIFVLKLDRNGDFNWAKSVGGNSSDVGYSLTNDAAGNVYITGFYASNLDFDPGPGVFNVTVEGAGDIFIQKLDANGDFVWVRTVASVFNEGAYSIRIDHQDNLYITGHYLREVKLDLVSGVLSLKSEGGRDVLVLKMNTGGDFLWAKSFGGKLHDIGQFITTDVVGGIYVTGSYSGTVDFGTESTAKSISSAGGSDAYVVKLDSTGTVVWSKSMGGTDQDAGTSAVMDDKGNLYVTGTYGGTCNVDPGEEILELTSNGLADIFVQKFSPWPLTIDTDKKVRMATILPNPTTGTFSIVQHTLQATSVLIYNSLGEIVVDKKLTGTRVNEFELYEPSGLYVVVLNFDDHVETFKLIKQ